MLRSIYIFINIIFLISLKRIRIFYMKCSHIGRSGYIFSGYSDICTDGNQIKAEIRLHGNC